MLTHASLWTTDQYSKCITWMIRDTNWLFRLIMFPSNSSLAVGGTDTRMSDVLSYHGMQNETNGICTSPPVTDSVTVRLRIDTMSSFEAQAVAKWDSQLENDNFRVLRHKQPYLLPRSHLLNSFSPNSLPWSELHFIRHQTFSLKSHVSGSYVTVCCIGRSKFITQLFNFHARQLAVIQE